MQTTRFFPACIYATTVASVIFLYILMTPFVSATEATSTASSSRESESMATTSPLVATTTETETFATQLEEHRASLGKKKQDRTYNLIQNITGRMEAVVFRFEHIAGRIESRAGILEGQGTGTGDARAHLAQARTELSGARTILASDLGQFAWSLNPQKDFVDVRERIRLLGNHLRTARAELTLALNALAFSTPVTASTTDITS